MSNLSNFNNTCIDITELLNTVNGKTFEQVKITMEELKIKVKENEKLYLLISDHNDNESKLDRICNGIILEKETNNVICMSQHKLLEIDRPLQQEQIETMKANYKMRMEYCEDATRISLYNYNGVWVTATTKCIDAKTSFWSAPKTFDELFWEVFDKDFVNELDPNFTYTFLLTHVDNRIVVKHKYNNLIYVSRINNKTQNEDYTNYFYKEGPKRTIRRPKQIDTFTINYPLDDYFLPNKRGIIVKFLINNSWESYQYDFLSYSQMKEIRGNVPSIRLRYLELLSKPEFLVQLEMCYSENFFLFAVVKHQLTNLYKTIHQLYMDSHVKHSLLITEHHPYFITCKQLHAQYKKTGDHITLDQVKNKINSLDKYTINKLLGCLNF